MSILQLIYLFYFQWMLWSVLCLFAFVNSAAWKFLLLSPRAHVGTEVSVSYNPRNGTAMLQWMQIFNFPRLLARVCINPSVFRGKKKKSINATCHNEVVIMKREQIFRQNRWWMSTIWDKLCPLVYWLCTS